MTTKKPAPLHKGMELDKNFRVTTVEVDKDQLLNEFAMGAAALLPHIKTLNKKQLQRVLKALVYAPVAEPPNGTIKDEEEAIMVINFLRLQDLKIALAELIDQELEDKQKEEAAE